MSGVRTRSPTTTHPDRPLRLSVRQGRRRTAPCSDFLLNALKYPHSGPVVVDTTRGVQGGPDGGRDGDEARRWGSKMS
jgi:hypothetical protein